MDRVKTLIDKLQAQLNSGAPLSSMLNTSQMLQAELALLTRDNKTSPSGKIAVILPETHISANTLEEKVNSVDQEKIIEVLQVDEREIQRELDEIKKQADKKQSLRPTPLPQMSIEFDPIEDVPTLAQQPYKKPDTHSVTQEKIEFPKVGEVELSLNEKLKEERIELSESLTLSPIKDLRKAIEINDRFLYINELFRGDEVMFDRSIKTIQGFKIFAEAEFWIRRELKLKLGWHGNDPLVKKFDELIRRRFM